MMDSKDKHLLVEIAVMYYLEGKTQTEIAKEMFMSRPKVSRLLQRARDLDIVDIKINYESDDFNRLKTQIQHRFGVENVVIVKTLSNEDETIKEMGRAAANEIKYHLNDNITIGMSWGRSVKQAVKGFKRKPMKNIKIVELFGAVEYKEDTQNLLSIGYEFSNKINGTFYPLPAPVYIHDEMTRRVLLQSPIINKTLKMIDECDLIITGLGVVNSNLPQTIWDMHVDPKARQELLDLGAVGFICAHFFDQDGNFIDHEMNERVIGIKTEKIKQNKIVLIAGGLSKCKAIYAILKGGHINTLICDDMTLRKVIEADKSYRGDKDEY